MVSPKNKASSRRRKPKGSSRSRKLKKEKTRSDQGAFDFSEWLPPLGHFPPTVSLKKKMEQVEKKGKKKKKTGTSLACSLIGKQMSTTSKGPPSIIERRDQMLSAGKEEEKKKRFSWRDLVELEKKYPNSQEWICLPIPSLLDEIDFDHEYGD